MHLYLLSGTLLLNTEHAETEALPRLLEETTGIPRRHLQVHVARDHDTGTVVMTQEVPRLWSSHSLSQLAELKSWDCQANPVVGGWARGTHQPLAFAVERMAALDGCLWFMECSDAGQYRAAGSRHGFPTPCTLEAGRLVWQVDGHECPALSLDFAPSSWFRDPAHFRETLYLNSVDRGARIEMRRGAERVLYQRGPT